MKCRVFMARVQSTKGPRWPMELDTLDGRNTRSSCTTEHMSGLQYLHSQ